MQRFALPVAREMEQVEAVLQHYLHSEVELVNQVVQYIIQNGGKRLRPLLTLLSAKVCGYQGEESAARLGAAMELIHTASLMHDDVVDDAPLRRGKPSAKAKWGNSVSVLVGDFFWCMMSKIIVEQGCLRTLKVVTDTITATTEAEILEITKHSNFSVTEEDYLRIVRGKTAVLLAACCQIGAILGGVSEKHEMALRRYGYDMGVAFQLADDILDYESEEEKFGKHKGGDLREGKLTLPLIVALRCGTEKERQTIKNVLLSGKIDLENFRDILEIIRRYGGIQEAESRAREFVEKAKRNLEIFKPSLERDALIGLADYAVEREI